MTTRQQTSTQVAEQPQRVGLQVFFTSEERWDLKRRALERRTTMQGLIRAAIGLPEKVDEATMR
jgi:hypothetical protein